MPDKKIEIGKVYGDVNVGQFGIATKSFLGKVIVSFSELASQEEYEEEGVEVPFEIEDKISHNNVVQYAYLLEEYVTKQKALKEVYDSVEEVDPFARKHVLKSVKREYQKWRGVLLADNSEGNKSELEVVRENSDFIIGKVIGDIKSKLVGIESVKVVNEELLTECVDLVVSDAFVECKILENPNR